MAMRNKVVIRKAGQMISPQYVEKAVKDSSYMGIAMVHDGKLIIDHRKGVPMAQAVHDVQTTEEFKDTPIIFNFGEGGKTLLDEDMQPFHIQLDATNSIALFMDGKFEGYAQKGSSHTDDFHCKEDFLSLKLKKLFKAGGMAGLIEELKDPVTQQDFSNSWTNFGFMAFLASTGEIIHIANKGNLFVKEFNWGYSSNGLNHIDKVEEPPKVEPDKPMSLKDRLLAKRSGTIAAVPEPIVPVVPADGDFEEVRLPDEAKDATKWTNKVKSAWWFNEVGYQPEGYKLMATVVKRYKGTKRGILAPLSADNIQDAATVIDKIEASGVTSMQVDPKTLPDKVAPENMKDTAPKHVLIDNIPIIGPKAKKNLREKWFSDADVIKTLGDDMKVLSRDPKRLKELEDTMQTFTDGLGLPDDTFLSFEALMKLGIVDIRSLAVYAFNKQNDCISAEIKLNSIIADPANKIARAAM